jgi:hypothetical protein
MPVLSGAAGAHQYGRAASVDTEGRTAATGSTALLTYTAERTGLYRVSVVLRTRTAGTGASQSVKPQVAYNNGTAVAAKDVLPFVSAAPTAYDLTAAAGTEDRRDMLIRAVAGSAIILTLLGSGTFTLAAKIDVHATIEAV